MKMRKKLGIVLVIGLVLIYLMAINVFGYSYTTSLVPDKTSVAKGDSVVVTIKLSGIDAGNGLFNFSAVLNYDTEVFEEVTQASFEASQDNGWTVSYDQSTKKMLFENTRLVTTEQNIGTITLRAKSEVSASSATIGLTEITASNDADSIPGTDISTTVQISDVSSGGGLNPGQNTTNTPGNSLTTNGLNTTNDAPADGNFINEIGDAHYFFKPYHVARSQNKNAKSYTQFLLMGMAPDQMFSTTMKEMFNTRKWLKMFGGFGAALLGVTVLSQFFFGKMKVPEGVKHD